MVPLVKLASWFLTLATPSLRYISLFYFWSVGGFIENTVLWSIVQLANFITHFDWKWVAWFGNFLYIGLKIIGSSMLFFFLRKNEKVYSLMKVEFCWYTFRLSFLCMKCFAFRSALSILSSNILFAFPHFEDVIEIMTCMLSDLGNCC